MRRWERVSPVIEARERAGGTSQQGRATTLRRASAQANRGCQTDKDELHPQHGQQPPGSPSSS